ncbi:MAG TPA: dephospho-CoA kinase [Desulfurivibrionaceae bacterium]|nr:dephospho-CoA kinase [Desulfurivibrionaceae bacterium]
MSEAGEKSWPPLALTGGIGSGKSTVAELFRAHGALVISADQVSRELLEPGGAGFRKLREEFGDLFITAAGQVDRGALRRAIFTDPVLRARVDALLHPLIRARIAEMVAGADRQAWPIPTRTPVYRGIVIEVPLLYEVGWQDDFGCVVVVGSAVAQSLDRLMARDRISRSEAEAALAAQLPMREKVARADLVIDNQGDLSATALQVARVIDRLLSGESCRKGIRNSSPSI